jgi:hypothetical protein
MWASILALVLAVDLPATAPSPAEDESPPVGLVAGAATVMVPLIVGGVLLSHVKSPRLETTGVIVMASGFALAPWVAHGIEGKWRRAALYGGISLTLSAAAVVAMEASDAFNPTVGNRVRIPMGIFLPLSMATSLFGVITSAFDRHGLERPPQLTLWLAPAAGGAAGGVGWSGSL